MSDTRIPRTILGFNPYIIKTNNYLVQDSSKNAKRLGVSDFKVQTWTGFLTEWQPLYLHWIDEDIRSTDDSNKLHEIIANTVAFDYKYHFLNNIASSESVTSTDMGMFNINKGELTETPILHTIPKTPINEPILLEFKQVGGGNIGIKCRHSKSKRAGIFEEADSVQYQYIIQDKEEADKSLLTLTADAPGLRTVISTKGSFRLETGPSNSGKYLLIFLRWYHTKHPEIAGSWSGINRVIIV